MTYVRLQVNEVFSLSKLFLFLLSKLFLLTLGKRTHFQFSFADLVRNVMQDNKKIPLLLKDLLNSIFTEKKILQAHILCHCPTVKAPFPPLWIVRLISFLLPCKSKKIEWSAGSHNGENGEKWYHSTAFPQIQFRAPQTDLVITSHVDGEKWKNPQTKTYMSHRSNY